MTEQPKEPSQWAKDAVVKQSFPLSIGDIARLIDAATAQRDAEIKRLKIAGMEASCARDFADLASERKDQRIAQLEALLDGAMEVFKTYLNVPEAAALREKWEKLKGQ